MGGGVGGCVGGGGWMVDVRMGSRGTINRKLSRLKDGLVDFS